MIFSLAWRNIWRNRSRSVVIIISVIIGLLAGIGVLSLYKGMMKSRVRKVIDSEMSHLQIHHPEFKKDYSPGYIIPDVNILNKLTSIPGVKLVAPRSIVQGMLVTPTGSTGVQINGIVPALEYKVSGLQKKIIAGEGFHAGKTNEIMIGRKLSDKMKLKKGSKLVLTFTDTTGNIVSAAFRVTGIYQSGNTALDEFNVYVTLPTLNQLLLIGNAYHEIAIILDRDDILPQMLNSIKAALPNLQVESWQDLSPETQLMVETVDTYSYIIMLIILVALAFGILNTMLMSVLERTREIGMMMALGTSRKRIFILVWLETILLTLSGIPIGLLIAYFITSYYQQHGLDLSGMGREMMASFGFDTMIYPEFPWEKLLVIMFMVIGTAVLSCIIPAIKALRMQPVEALRQ